jgi:hypothetical protein
MVGWRVGEAYCDATNKDGTPCGNKVARGASGYIIYRKCALHRRMAERAARAAREQKGI